MKTSQGKDYRKEIRNIMKTTTTKQTLKKPPPLPPP